MSGEIFDQVFSDKTDDLQNETPTQDQVLLNAINAALLEVHTCLPAKIVRVRGTAKVDIQTQIKRKFKDGTIVDLPIIQNVLVMHPRGADYGIKLPIAVGDTGLALFCERSLDVWAVSGGQVDPKDGRHHQLTDAIFIPGLYPSSNQISGAATDMVLQNGTNATITMKKDGDMVLKNGDATITLQKAGKFLIKGNPEELFNNLITLMNTLIAATVIDPISGPLPFDPSTITQLNLTKTKLTSLKGS